MKLISLTQNKFTMVDDGDYEFLMQWKWCLAKHSRKNLFYAKRAEGKKTILMHRAILNITNPKIQVDHENGNGLNNMRVNIRVATPAQNSQNRCGSRDTSSKYKGVSFRGNKWNAAIKISGKTKYLGRFTNELEAALAYDNAARRHYGEFARLNVLQ